VAAVVATPITQNQTLVFNNAAGVPIAQQGNTLYGTPYGLQQAVSVYSADPNLAMTLNARIADNAVSAFSSTATLALKGNESSNKVAAIQAATAHLQSALTVDQPAQTLIVQTKNGQVVNVQSLAAGQQANTEPAKPDLPPAPNPERPTSMLALKCAKCHGAQLQAPKGGLFYDVGIALTSDQILQAIDAVATDKMPKGDKLDAETKGALLDELLQIGRAARK